MTRFARSSLAVALIITLLAPSFFLSFPPQAKAISVAVIGDISFPTHLLTLAKDTLTSISTYTSAAANVAQQVNTYVLQPLAFVMSVGLLKALTAGVLAFVIGDSNGTGKPQFVQDLQGTLQKVGDIKAQAFFIQFGKISNSPFSASITSSLRTNYLQQTSLAGFWAANKCTLTAASPNVNAFLAGNWSQGGGVRAWMSLTTQPQNNPFMLSQNAQGQLASLVATAQDTRTKVLNWGQGFMAWCGDYDASASTGKSGASPGDDCDKGDGTTGTMKTPGSTIKATLDKALGSVQDKLTQIGSLAKEVNSILSDVATVFQTINLAQSILGGSGSGGLAGFGTASAGGGSALNAYNRSAFLGVTQTTVNQNAAALQSDIAQQMATRVNDYNSGWATVNAVALSAKAALTQVAATCPSYAADAQQAETQQVEVVFARVAQAQATVAAAKAFLDHIASKANQDGTAASTQYQADLSTLQTMAPTVADYSAIQQDSLPGSGASATGSNTLIVSGGSLVDQLTQIKTNAMALLNYCNGGLVDRP